jgi:hypothetical protein
MTRFMLKKTLTLSLLALAMACQRAEAPKTPASGTPAPSACNNLTINPAVSVAPGTVTEAASVAPDAQAALLGGPIPPGLYDLVRADPRAGAQALTERLWETVRVSDSEAGQVLDFAIVRGAASNTPNRVSARIEEGPPARLVHTCGASGGVGLSWTAPRGELHLLLPAAQGAGQMLYVFQRRAG